ncbi:MAG: filamentous hemagglutinin N-terminal domain-containing protein [Magnetococcus sp. YQC-5]
MNPTFNGDLAKTNGVYAIKQEFGKTAGTNLFHSFAKFGLTAGETADFQGSNVNNIISRVTGGTKSNIDGTIKSSISGANLYLMNPSGVMFGPNASLDVSGSFHVTTADYLKFGEEGKFHTNPNTTSQFVTVNPTAFGFLGAKPAAITFSGAGALNPTSKEPVSGKGMTVPTGKTLSVVGGDLTFTSNKSGTQEHQTFLTTPKGQINSASVASPGEVLMTREAVLPLDAKQVGGVITMNAGSVLNVSGEAAGSIQVLGGSMSMVGSELNAIATGNGGGGVIDMQLRGHLTLTDGAIVRIENQGTGMPGAINITASGDLTLLGENSRNSSAITAATTGKMQNAGEGGYITIKANNLILQDGGWIGANTSGPGMSGSIDIKALGDVNVSGKNSKNYSIIMSDSTGKMSDAGVGGSIDIDVKQSLVLKDGGRISVNTVDGFGGWIDIKASDLTVSGLDSSISALSSGTGYGGYVFMDVANLSLRDGGQINITNSSTGEGGYVSVNATGNMTISGESGKGNASSILAKTTGGMPGAGAGGSINLNIANLTLKEGGKIIADTEGTGNGGSITINASGDVTLSGYDSQKSASAISVSARSEGTGGDIELTAANLLLKNKGSILANTTGSGMEEDVAINAYGGVKHFATSAEKKLDAGMGGFVTLDVKNNIVLQDGGQINSNTVDGEGGIVSIKATDMSVSGGDSSITATSSGSGYGGYVFIDVVNLSLLDGGQINITNSGTGAGGYIQVKASGKTTLSGEDSQGNVSSMQATTKGEGEGGYIDLNVAELILSNGAKIVADTEDSGAGGNITITASGNVTVSGYDSQEVSSSISVVSGEESTGAGGKIDLTAANLLLMEGGSVVANADGEGRGGDIKIKTNGDIRISSNNKIGLSSIDNSSDGAGGGGDIDLNVVNLTIDDGTWIFSDVSGTGSSGNITITASGDVTLAGTWNDGTGSYIQAKTNTPDNGGKGGNAGNIKLDVANLTIRDGGYINSTTESSGLGGRIDITASKDVMITKASIEAESHDVGNGGTIKLKAANLFLNEGGLITTNTNSTGRGGSIFIQTLENMTLSGKTKDEAEISSSVQSISKGTMSDAGAGGNISLTVQNLSVLDGGTVMVNSEGTAQAGKIDIIALGDVKISGEGSIQSDSIGKTTDVGAGAGGNISFRIKNLFLTDGGQVSVNTVDGKGGHIAMDARDVTISGDSSISATSSGSGVGGDIILTGANFTLIDSGRINITNISTGKGGSFSLYASGNVMLNDGGWIEASTKGTGEGGSITIETVGDIKFLAERKEDFSGIEASSYDAGAGGKINLKAANITIHDGALITSDVFDTGHGGSINITATGDLTVAGTSGDGWGSGIGAKSYGFMSTAANAGDIKLNVANLIVKDGGYIDGSTKGAGFGGVIDIEASKNIIISGLNVSGGNSDQHGVLAETYGYGSGGNIKLKADNLFLNEGGVISTTARSLGGGGNIFVKTSGDVTISGKDNQNASSIKASSEGRMANAGAGGNISLNVKNLSLLDGGIIEGTTIDTGKGGKIDIKALGDVKIAEKGSIKSDSKGNTPEAGTGGNVSLAMKNLSLTSGGQISVNTFDGIGGDITVTASDVTVLGEDSSISALSSGSGSGGGIIIDVASLNLKYGGQINITNSGKGRGGSAYIYATGDVILSGEASKSKASTIQAKTLGGMTNAGEGGSIYLDSANLTLKDGGKIIADTEGTGRGGTINVVASGDISLAGLDSEDDASKISVSSISRIDGAGAGGDIRLNSANLFLKDGGSILANTFGPGNGGNISISTVGDIQLSNFANIQAISTGDGTGGTIRLNSANLTMLRGGWISADVYSKGPGGSIDITTSGDVTLADASNGWISYINAASLGYISNAGSAGNITLDVANLIVKDGAKIDAGTESEGRGGFIQIKASKDIIISGEDAVSGSKSMIQAQSQNSGFGGDVSLESVNLFVKDGGMISTNAKSTGSGGFIYITTSGNLTISGRSSAAASSIQALSAGHMSDAGSGGSITLKVAANVSVLDGGTVQVNTSGPGGAGFIDIKALNGDVLISGGDKTKPSSIMAQSIGTQSDSGSSGYITLDVNRLNLAAHGAISVSTSGRGAGGMIDVQAKQLYMENGGSVSSSSGSGDVFAGSAGEIKIIASEKLEMNQNSLIVTEAESGAGGNVFIQTSALSGSDNSKISASVHKGSSQGGNVTLGLTTLSLSKGSMVESSTDGAGKGGTIGITATSTQINSGSKIASNSNSVEVNAGQAGSITLKSTDQLMMNGGSITSSAKKGGGGDITVQVKDRIHLQAKSEISTSVEGGDGNGGNIFIDPINLILKDSKVMAKAVGGDGGKMKIVADSMIKDKSSILDASSTFGVQGSVEVDTPNVNPVDSLSALPVTFFDASSLMSERCSARRGNSSSFVMKGRGGLPLMPGDLLSSHGLSAHYPVTALGENSDSFNSVGILEKDAKVLCLM